MPDQYGNPTPQEVMGQIMAERDMMVSSARTAQDRRVANMASLGKAVFAGFDPRMIKANEINDTLGRALQLEREEGEDQLDYQIRQGRAAFEEMKEVDPTTAANISSKLIELESERMERSFLKQSRDQELRMGEQDIAAADQEAADTRRESMFDNIHYGFDPQSGEATGEFVDFSDPNFAEQLRTMVQAGHIPMPAEDMLGLVDMDDAFGKIWNNSDHAAHMDEINSHITNVTVANQLADVFKTAIEEAGDNPVAFQDSLSRKLGGVLQSLEDIKGLGPDGHPVPGDPRFERDRAYMAQRLREEGIRSGVSSALLTTLAYTRARTFDNRVTDADFRFALESLGGKDGDMALVMGSLRNNIFGDRSSVLNSLGTELDSTLKFVPEGSEAWIQANIQRDQLDKFSDLVDTFDGTSSSVQDLLGVSDAVEGGGPRSTGTTITINGQAMPIR